MLLGTVLPVRLVGRWGHVACCGAAWRCLRGIAGRRPCRPVDGERGKRPGGARRTLGFGAGAPSAVAVGAWRRTRSSPGPGKPAAWRRGPVSTQHDWNGRSSPVNTGGPFPSLVAATERVLHVQRKLHEWASNDAECRFRDVWNLVCDPATLVVAWSRVSRNRGSRTAGVDAETRRHVEARGVEQFLVGLRGELRSGTFRPLPVRERLIPKRDGRMRRLGIPTVTSYREVVQRAFGFVGGHASVSSVAG